jgi:pseudaminic acid cytidylyltransferase
MKIAVIPARGGSKRIPRKNIKPFAGKPMIAYAIAAARASGLFDHVVVSTDDAEIAQVARDHGAEVPFMRAAALSDDFAGTEEVIADAIRQCDALGWHADLACCIYPGVPLLRAADLAVGLELLQRGTASYAMTVVRFPSAIQRALKRGADGRMDSFYPEHREARTQDLEPAFYDGGQFYWGRREAWLSGRGVHSDAAGLEIPEWRAVDIDTLDDWHRAELLFAQLCGNGDA